MRRRVARFVFVILVGTIAMVLGVLTSMMLTPPGRALLARTVSQVLDDVVLGQVEVGSISGSFLSDLVLENLVVRDTSGTLLAELPVARVRYQLRSLLQRQLVLSAVQLDRPTIQLIKYRNGRMNYEEVLRLGKGKPGGRSPLIEFHDVRVDSGTLSIATPWNPAAGVRTAAVRDSALRAERAKPGRVIAESPEGLRKVITLADLTTRITRLRIATPDRKPFTVDLDSLATRVSDPGVTVVDAAGRIQIRGDSAIFSLERGALLDTRFSGGGSVMFSGGQTLYDFQVVASRVNLVDLRWVSPDFPEMSGTGVLAARSESPVRTAFDIRELHLIGRGGRVDGDLVALIDARRGLGVREMNLRLRDLNLDAVRPYLDTLPFDGTLTGTVRGAGFLDALDMTVDWAFADAQVPGNPVTTIAGVGRVGSHRTEGLTFTGFAVNRSDIDLRTVRRLAPAVIVDGRLAATGTLDGPLHNATFRGTLEHQDGARPVSRAEGMVRLDTRTDTLALATDLVFDPLAFDGIRPAFPSLTARGGLQGRFISEGTLARLAVDASLRGELGDVQARGFVTLLPPKWGAEDLLLRFSRLDLAALTGRDQLPTSLNGELHVTGTLDTLRAPEADLRLALSSSLARDATLDTVFAIARIHDSVLTLDTAFAAMRGARAFGSGGLGWGAARTGKMLFTVAVDSLVAFDTLFLAALEQQRDTAPDARPLGGQARSTILLSGSLDSLEASGDLLVEHLEWQRFRTARVSGAFAWNGGARPYLTVGIGTDSLDAGDRSFRQAGAQARGWIDSLNWSAGTTFGIGSRLDGAGRWWRTSSAQVVAVDSLVADLLTDRYRLRETAILTLSDSAPSLTPVTLTAVDGSAGIQLAGRVPGTAPGSLTVSAFGLGIRDLYGALERDTTGIGGELGLDLQVGGTARAPTLRGTGQLSAVQFGEFQAPFIQSTVDYADRQLAATLELWRTGERLLNVQARLPVDLAFVGAKRRLLDGPLFARAQADSIDLGILEAITPAVRDVRGRLSGDVQMNGTWAARRLEGQLAVRNGAMAVPGLGVRFEGMEGRARLRGDSLLLQDVKLESGGGILHIGGSVRFPEDTLPVLGLAFEADRFLAMNIRSLGTLTASTERLTLDGPFFGATLRGTLTATSGVIYFADLLNKRVIALDDPTIADLIDTTLIRRQRLGAGFQNRFLDAMRIDNLQVQLGTDVWLRSAEANIKLDGAVRLSKVGKEYTPTGTINALRGSYALKVGPVTRDFILQKGTVQYQGNLNADLDLEARHDVRTIRDEEIPIIARIGGQLYAPKLTLESTIRPPISETDLYSYLTTGRPASEVAVNERRAFETAVNYFSNAVSSELERAIIQDLGAPLDLIEIRPGVNYGQFGTTLTQLAAGWQIGRKTFLTLNAGFCPTQLREVRPENLGVSMEFRFSHEWRLQSSIEPALRTCGPTTNQIASSWQFGTDIFWEWDY